MEVVGVNELMEAAARAVAEKSSGWGWASARDDERKHYVDIASAVLVSVRDLCSESTLHDAILRVRLDTILSDGA